ncbi:hypothetical protein QR680_011633 [Steinernema hermaphroditum]|uniref:Uncharacterized protein n=1 Tax=Steinernema hermaphroditum TaxID=289476 RepID=A0AA39I1G0_9BILA|nr:hypothetical protein QR680_011633 [Steinernema hermaphroditum]
MSNSSTTTSNSTTLFEGLSGDLRINGRTGIAIAIIVFVILLSSILASVVGCIYCYVANKKKKEQEDQEGAVLDSVTSTSA